MKRRSLLKILLAPLLPVPVVAAAVTPPESIPFGKSFKVEVLETPIRGYLKPTEPGSRKYDFVKVCPNDFNEDYLKAMKGIADGTIKPKVSV